MKDKEATLIKSFKSNTPMASVIGRVSVDSCTILKREVKSNSYKLDDLGKEFLCEPKIHLPYSEIQNKYQTTEGRAFLAAYCLKDAWLSMELLKHFDILHLYLIYGLASLDLKRFVKEVKV